MVRLTKVLTSGEPPKYVGVVLNESFPGTTLNATNFSGSLPANVTINNKLIVATGGGATNWSSYIQFVKYYTWERAEWSITFKAVDKVANGGWGFSMNNLLVSNNILFYLKVDLSNGVNSGRVSIGIDDVNANNQGYSQALAWSAGDTLKLTVKKSPGKTVTYLENITVPATPVAYGEFDLKNWGTQNLIRLSFLSGQQEFTNITINSYARNFGGTKGAVVLGDSIALGYGADTIDRRWVNEAMLGQQHLYEVIGNASWLSGTFTSTYLNEVLTPIAGKYLIVNVGYNDANQVTTGTFQTNLTTIVTTAQGLGYTVILVDLFPNATIDKSAWNTMVSTVGTANSVKVILVNAQFVIAGNLANPQYLAPDSVHPNSDGHSIFGKTVAKEIPEVYSVGLTPSLSIQDLGLFDLPYGKDSEDLLMIDYRGFISRGTRKKIADNLYIILQSTITKTQAGGAAIAGIFINGNYFWSKNTNGLQLNGFDGVNTNNVGPANNVFWGVTSNPTATGPGFVIWGAASAGNIFGIATSTSKPKASAANVTINGLNNTMFNSLVGATFAGSDCVMLGAYSYAGTSGNNQLYFGSNAGRGVSTAGQLFHAITRNSSAASMPAAVGDYFYFGDMSACIGDAPISGDFIFCAYIFGNHAFWFGGKVAPGSVLISYNSAANSGTNQAGNITQFNASRGTGLAEGGLIRFRTTAPGSTGTTLHSSFVTPLQLERQGLTVSQTATPVKALDAILDIQSTSQGLLLPRMTKAQRDQIVQGILTHTIATPGTGQTTGTWPLVITGGTGTAATGYATVSGGIIQSVTWTGRGIYSVAPTSITIAGGGTPGTITVTLGATNGLAIFQTDNTPGLRVYNGTNWMKFTETID